MEQEFAEMRAMQKLKRGEFYLLDGRNRVAALESLDWIDFEDNGWPDISGYTLEFDAGQPIIFGPEVDPYHYVLSANIHRRHLTTEQKRDLIAKVLKAQPEKSNRTIAKQVKADHKTVGTVREKWHQLGKFPRWTRRWERTARRAPRSPTKKTRRADGLPRREGGKATG